MCVPFFVFPISEFCFRFPVPVPTLYLLSYFLGLLLVSLTVQDTSLLRILHEHPEKKPETCERSVQSAFMGRKKSHVSSEIKKSHVSSEIEKRHVPSEKKKRLQRSKKDKL